MTGDPLDRENMTDLRAQMIQGLNGNYVGGDIAWQIIHRWDAQEEVARAARALIRDGWESADNPLYFLASSSDADDLRAALARLDGPR